MTIVKRAIGPLLALLSLAACQQSLPPEPGMKVGKPYAINGKTYYPAHNPDYDKVGEASWYGPGFHGKRTANGEIYDQNAMTAAHPTLPMPSMVRVTNLSNGKSSIVRINDRGPFKKNRIIDLSRKSAETLGIKSLAQVRVEYLKEETERHLASLSSGGTADYAARRPQPEPRSGQIVEATVANTHAGQIVSDAAPIVTVSTDDISALNNVSTPKAAAPVRLRPIGSTGLLREAYAEEAPAPLPPPPAETAAVAEMPQNKAPPESLSPSSGGGLYIQAGSFAAEENARKLTAQLDGIAPAAVHQSMAGGKSWWRVRLGPFDGRLAARDALEKVHASGLRDARIVTQ